MCHQKDGLAGIVRHEVVQEAPGALIEAANRELRLAGGGYHPQVVRTKAPD
jgi:hypothetical protein